MIKKRPPDIDREAPQETPSTLAKLQYPENRWILWPLIFVLNLASLGLWLLGSGVFWIWHHRWATAEWIGVLFWRGTALLGVVYLVYDRIYEADATLSAPASDPKFAFEFPFAITNNSHVFTIRNVRWACKAVRLKWPTENEIANGTAIFGSNDAVGPSQMLNFDCGIIGPKSHVFRIGKVAFEEAVVSISLEYDADFFGLFSLHRRPPPTMFTWFADASNPQWIKGNPVR